MNTPQPTPAELFAMIKALREENEALKSKANAPRTLGLKVSAKGAVSLYGMGRWPVTLYAGQWAKVFAIRDQVEKFINDNKALLATKEAD